MIKKMVLMLAVVAILLGSLAYLKVHQVQSAVQAASFQPPPRR